MATTNLLPRATASFTFRRKNVTKTIPLSFNKNPNINCYTKSNNTNKLYSNWALRRVRFVGVDRLVEFLYEDLPHVFDDQGIDRTVYDDRLKFRDPITKHDSITGYLFNIALLKNIFTPQFNLHWVKQTCPYEITTRWTVVMRFMLFPWKPELVLTGTSVMKINPFSGKFCRTVDSWDSVENNEYFSFEGLLDVFKPV